MAGRRAFLDESKRTGYVVVVAVVVPDDLGSTRRALRALLLPGQSALHFKKERDGRRRQLLTAICGLEVEAHVYVCTTKDHVSARRRCVEAAATELLAEGAERLVLELSDGDLAADRRTLFDVTRTRDREARPLRYDHVRAPVEPLL